MGKRGAPAQEAQPSPDDRVIAVNRRARHDYHLEETYEAGLVLTGTEIKSLRAGHVSLVDSHAFIEHGEAWLYDMHIAPYEHGNRFNHDPRRRRKLLLHKEEIDRMFQKARLQGYTLIPTRIYLKRGRAKVEIAVARGKKQYDKRHAIAEREAKRRIERALKQRD
ncbi:MAG: SsrA-binding protein SmpB [Firmicutes bacterium]|nr:SsrA-binding protein SmpB [Bacillota bacterium]